MDAPNTARSIAQHMSACRCASEQYCLYGSVQCSACLRILNVLTSSMCLTSKTRMSPSFDTDASRLSFVEQTCILDTVWMSPDNMCLCCWVAAQTKDDCHGVLCAVLGPVVAGAYSQLRKLPIHMARLYAHAGEPFPPLLIPCNLLGPWSLLVIPSNCMCVCETP